MDSCMGSCISFHTSLSLTYQQVPHSWKACDIEKKATKNELTCLSLPHPLSCITSCLSYHLASPYPEIHGRYLDPVHLLYSIGSRPAKAKEECSESEVWSISTRTTGKGHSSAFLGLEHHWTYHTRPRSSADPHPHS